MNIHHLELFYYVARHGGISEAVRNMPYGIQQPAVSIQILRLEELLGTKLFNRRPFQLTTAGKKLFAFVEPFFGNVDRIAAEIRGDASPFIRLGASNTVLRNHFPNLIQQVRTKLPGLKFTLHDGIEPQLVQWLERQEIDLAVTVLLNKSPGINSQPLLRLPLQLVVPTSSKLKSTVELLKQDKIEEPLICLPPAEPITRCFLQQLNKRGVEWHSTIVINSLDLVETYAACGYGIGLSVVIPGAKSPPGLRRLRLEGFDPIVVGAMWHGQPTTVIEVFLSVFRHYCLALDAAQPPEKREFEFAHEVAGASS
jgi:DNA-binding transcriptional LysR family regulator